MLELINNYAQVINITLLIVIIGWLFRIYTLSRTVLIDKYESKVQGLQSELKAREIEYEEETRMLQRDLKIYERLTSLPKDQQVEGLRAMYELKINALEEREKKAGAVEEREAIKSEKSELEEIYSSIKELEISDITKVAQFVASIGHPHRPVISKIEKGVLKRVSESDDEELSAQLINFNFDLERQGYTDHNVTDEELKEVVILLIEKRLLKIAELGFGTKLRLTSAAQEWLKGQERQGLP